MENINFICFILRAKFLFYFIFVLFFFIHGIIEKINIEHLTPGLQTFVWPIQILFIFNFDWRYIQIRELHRVKYMYRILEVYTYDWIVRTQYMRWRPLYIHSKVVYCGMENPQAMLIFCCGSLDITHSRTYSNILFNVRCVDP